MQIDNNRAILVQSAISDTQTPQGVWCEFYQIDGVLALQHLPGHDLTGHPGHDLLTLPNGEQYIYHIYLRPAEASRINNWLKKGLYTALSIQLRRNTTGTITKTKLGFSWRNPDDYLTPDQQAWLEAYGVTSYDYTDKLQAALAFSHLAQRLYTSVQTQTKAKSKSNHKRPRLRAKDRRQRDRRQRILGGK